MSDPQTIGHTARTVLAALGRARLAAGDWTPVDEAREQRRERFQQCMLAYGECGLRIPKAARFSSDVVQRCVHPDILEALVAYRPGMGSRIICAPMGAGKLLAAQALMSRLWHEITEDGADNCEQRSRMHYAKASHIAPQAFKRGEDASRHQANLRAWRTCHLLIVDEMGKASDNRDRDLFNTVDDRYLAGLDTIALSGNYAWRNTNGEPSLKDIYGAPLLDRFIRRGPSGAPGKLIEVT